MTYTAVTKLHVGEVNCRRIVPVDGAAHRSHTVEWYRVFAMKYPGDGYSSPTSVVAKVEETTARPLVADNWIGAPTASPGATASNARPRSRVDGARGKHGQVCCGSVLDAVVVHVSGTAHRLGLAVFACLVCV